MAHADETLPLVTSAPFNFDLNDDELRHVLRSIDVAIPTNSKLPHAALQKRLHKCLNAAEEASRLLPKEGPLDVEGLKPWPKGKEVLQSTQRGTLHEAMMASFAQDEGLDPSVVNRNALTSLRQQVMALASLVDMGIRTAILQPPDKDHQRFAISVRILEVYQIDKKTPLLLVLYMPATTEDPGARVRWVESLSRLPHHIAATELEQKVLLKLLEQNAKHIPADFSVDHVKSETEGPFKVSFLLPVAPLSSEDLGKLTTEFGCSVCGEKAISRCSKCQGVWYCGKKCQLEDWQAHKATCRPLKRETWVTVPFSSQIVIPGVDTSGLRVGSILSNRSSTNSKKKMPNFPVNSDTPPANIHGDKLFIVKMQLPMSENPGTGGSMLVYDRQKSVMGYVYARDKPQEYEKLRKECDEKGQFGGLKMYRYAKRVGDWALSICVEREPEGVVNW